MDWREITIQFCKLRLRNPFRHGSIQTQAATRRPGIFFMSVLFCRAAFAPAAATCHPHFAHIPEHLGFAWWSRKGIADSRRVARHSNYLYLFYTAVDVKFEAGGELGSKRYLERRTEPAECHSEQRRDKDHRFCPEKPKPSSAPHRTKRAGIVATLTVPAEIRSTSSPFVPPVLAGRRCDMAG